MQTHALVKNDAGQIVQGDSLTTFAGQKQAKAYPELNPRITKRDREMAALNKKMHAMFIENRDRAVVTVLELSPEAACASTSSSRKAQLEELARVEGVNALYDYAAALRTVKKFETQMAGL